MPDSILLFFLSNHQMFVNYENDTYKHEALPDEPTQGWTALFKVIRNYADHRYCCDKTNQLIHRNGIEDTHGVYC